MMDRRLFILLRLIFMVLDKVILTLLGSRIRQLFIQLSYKIKVRLFPQYGSYQPSTNDISPESSNFFWLPPAIPEWVLREMRELAETIDPALYPSTNYLVKSQYSAFPHRLQPGNIYQQLMQACSAVHYSHCFALPWLKRGGADLVSLIHIETVLSTPGSRVLVILTEPGDSPWLDRLPNEVDVIHVSHYIAQVSHQDLLLVIARLLLQLRIDNLHIINSRHIWELVCKYGLALTQEMRIFASVFCDDRDQQGRLVGYARDFLPDCHLYLQHVLADTHGYPALLQSTYGYKADLFRVLKTPVQLPPQLAQRHPGKNKVLWAGRLDQQKRPDLLLAIATALPDVAFHVYGEPILSSNKSVLLRLKQSQNIHLHGAFNHAGSLPFADFPVFLYTSQWDGIPTIVIAAALAAIPLVASAVGGVPEIIDEERGYPIHDIEDVALYVARITDALNHPEEAESRALRAREYVLQEHSMEKFTAALAAIPGYMPSQAADGASTACAT